MAIVNVVVPGNERGGAATHLTALARAVRTAGRTALFSFWAVGDGPLATDMAAWVPLQPVPAAPVAAIRTLALHMRDGGTASLWHAHGPRVNVYLAVAATIARRRWVSTIHSDPMRDFLGSRWKTVILTRLNLAALKRADAWFVGNPAFVQHLPDKPWFHVPNALVAPELPHPADVCRSRLRQHLHLPAETPLVGTVARLDPVKDIPTILRALTDLPGVHLAVAGDGAQRSELEALAGRLGVSERVHWLGFVHPVGPFLAALDVHILASISEGSSPYAVLEAGYYGVPNVLSDIPATRHLVDPNDSALVFPVGDERALAAQVRRVLGDPALAGHLVRRFRETILPNFTLERMLEAYVEGYRALGLPVEQSAW
ncbi:glycosyltransferase [Alicyclobacillus sp.]|uniref:glycosyltransferase n=1 Tax=Alicyclobacillus sp. TaxID=61169 RepID=UPI0025C60CEF|nr:glycosyltransferase [Alicyclobacillus sp.]MCL6517395.1 glycosyltransferase [Alicyclobacillus sp.]